MAVTSRIQIALFAFALQSSIACGQSFDEKMDHWPSRLTINGSIVVKNDLTDDSANDEHILPLAKRGEKKILFLSFDGPLKARLKTQFTKRFSTDDQTKLQFANLKPGDSVDAKVVEQIAESSIVFFVTDGKTIKKGKLTDSLKEPITDFVFKRGVLVVDQYGIELLSAKIISGTAAKPELEEGWNLFQDCLIETEFNESEKQTRLQTVLKSHPLLIGVGLQPDTCLILQGRKCFIRKSGNALFQLAANDREPKLEFTLTPMTGRMTRSQLLDLGQWRRIAIDRQLEPFPPAKPLTPNVVNGTLMIVGGGGMPEKLMEQFIEAAGGVEKAKLVYVPCSEARRIPSNVGIVNAWKRIGIKSATFIHTKDRNLANTSDAILEPLRDATGIWFGGGRQWNFSDSYYGTEAHRLMKEVVKRGGVVGGSSAGASIQARYLARATPIGNFEIMAPGYERGGLGFISGVAIDQHFSQRGRQKDMTELMSVHPQLLGIGIDEATAITVKNSVATVSGRGKVHFYDRRVPVEEGKPDYVALPKGSVYDLAKRKIIRDTTEELQKENEKSEGKKKENSK